MNARTRSRRSAITSGMTAVAIGSDDRRDEGGAPTAFVRDPRARGRAVGARAPRRRRLEGGVGGPRAPGGGALEGGGGGGPRGGAAARAARGGQRDPPAHALTRRRVRGT